VREIEHHLDRCEFGEVEIYETVERLKELNLLDDRAYAEEFVKTRLNTKPVSRAHLRMQLVSHEIGQEAMDNALLLVDDEQEARSAALVAGKYARQYAKLPQSERDELVMRRLMSRGYGYDDARAALSALTEEGDES
jgi:regulatory protein